MKLFEITQNPQQLVGWLKPAPGPRGTTGVTLAYFLPAEEHVTTLINNTKEKLESGDESVRGRLKKLQNQLDHIKKTKTKHLEFNMGWWFNEKDFHDGVEGDARLNIGKIIYMYPNLTIVKNKEEAKNLLS